MDTSLLSTIKTMSTLEIAELTGKSHKNVMRDTKSMLKELEIDVLKFEHIYLDSLNRQQKMFNLPKRECLILVSGYNLTLRTQIIDRWEQLESQQTQIPQTYAEALRLAADTAEKLQQQTKLLEKATPKVDFYDQFANKDGLFGLQNAGRALHQGPNKFIRWLKQQYLFYQGGSLVAYQKYVQQGIFEIKTNIIDDKARPRVYVTPKGLQYLAKQLKLDPI